MVIPQISGEGLKASLLLMDYVCREERKQLCGQCLASDSSAVCTDCSKDSYEPVNQPDDAFTSKSINVSSTFFQSSRVTFQT